MTAARIAGSLTKFNGRYPPCLNIVKVSSVTYTVVVADDDRAIRESLARALELEGYAWPGSTTACRR
jgi:hypothetical protein